MAPPLRVMPARAVLAQLGGGLDPESAGVVSGRPVLAVAIDDTEAAAEAATELARLVRRIPAVLVGVHGAGSIPSAALAGYDVVVGGSDPDTLAEIEEGVRRAPHAAVALAQLLRLSAHLDGGDGLVAESLAYSLLQAGPEHRAWLAGRSAPRRRPPSPGPPVVTRREGGELAIVLNRPEVRNALDRAMRDELVAALRLAGADPSVERIELSGAGPAFCSGGDLDEFGTSPGPVEAHLVRTTRSPAAALLAVAPRAVARVHGTCAGAGTELAAFAGRVVAAPDTTFRLPELALGLIPGAGGTVSLPRRIGRQRTAYLAITGRVIDARTAMAWGLVDEIRPRGR